MRCVALKVVCSQAVPLPADPSPAPAVPVTATRREGGAFRVDDTDGGAVAATAGVSILGEMARQLADMRATIAAEREGARLALAGAVAEIARRVGALERGAVELTDRLAASETARADMARRLDESERRATELSAGVAQVRADTAAAWEAARAASVRDAATVARIDNEARQMAQRVSLADAEVARRVGALERGAVELADRLAASETARADMVRRLDESERRATALAERVSLDEVRVAVAGALHLVIVA